jgi:hypothetical protein
MGTFLGWLMVIFLIWLICDECVVGQHKPRN